MGLLDTADAITMATGAISPTVNLRVNRTTWTEPPSISPATNANEAIQPNQINHHHLIIKQNLIINKYDTIDGVDRIAGTIELIFIHKSVGSEIGGNVGMATYPNGAFW